MAASQKTKAKAKESLYRFLAMVFRQIAARRDRESREAARFVDIYIKKANGNE